MANPNWFDLSTSQLNALKRDGTILMNGVRYTQAPGTSSLIKYDRPEKPQDLEVGTRGIGNEETWKRARGSNWKQEMEDAYPGGRPSAPSPEQYGRYQNTVTDGRDRRESKLPASGVDNRGQSQYEHDTGDDFLGMLDLYEKRKKRGYS
jgi:hypothetical protein